MHEVKALIRPERLEHVVQELHTLIDLPGLTVSTVRGYGRRHGHAPGSDEYGEVAMVKLETVVPDEILARVLDIIQRRAATGRRGDGKVFVLPVESALKISSGEVGPEAL